MTYVYTVEIYSGGSVSSYTYSCTERQKLRNLCISSSMQVLPEQSTVDHYAANSILLRNPEAHHIQS
jgi:hypothetical protein